MPKPESTYSIEIERVVHVAVASAMSDFAALLLAYSSEGPLSDDIVAHAQQQVLIVLKNSSANSIALELQAVAFTRAVEEVNQLIGSAVRRGWPPFQGLPNY